MTAATRRSSRPTRRSGTSQQAGRLRTARDAGEVLAPATDAAQMDTVIFNSTVNGILQAIFARAGAGGGRQRAVVIGGPSGSAGCRRRRSRRCPRGSSRRPDFIADREEKAAAVAWEAGTANGGGRRRHAPAGGRAGRRSTGLAGRAVVPA